MRSIEHGSRRLFVMAGRCRCGKEHILNAAARLSSESDQPLQLLRADRVFGLDHLTSAFQKAVRAFAQGENASESLTTETMLYMSGGRQIQDAVGILGLEDDTEGLVCISADGQDILSRLGDEIGLEEDDQLLLDLTDKEMSIMGIADTALATVPEGKRRELVLERVASVDIMKK